MGNSFCSVFNACAHVVCVCVCVCACVCVCVCVQTSAMMRGCGVCGVVAAAVESLPLTEVDNVTVPLITGLVAAYGRVFR